MEDTLTDIFAIQDNTNNEVEVITDTEVSNTSVIPIDQLLQNEKQEVNIQTNNKEALNEKPKKDKVLMVQIILLVIWAILTALLYFFGYDLFAPFINVD